MLESIFTITCLVFVSGLLIFIFANFRKLSTGTFGGNEYLNLISKVSVKEMGILEGHIPNLKQVIVVADKIERPTDTLSKAVEKNFENGVKYLFLVSSTRAESELMGYYLLFQSLARIVSARQSSSPSANTYITIQKLSHDWDDSPYVFYQYEEKNTMRTLAIRGKERGEGIADNYEIIDPRFAHTIARAVLSDAPTKIEIHAEQFEQSDNVTSIIEELEQKMGNERIS